MQAPAEPPASLVPDTISITEDHRDEIRSHGADVVVKLSRTGGARRPAAALAATRRHLEHAGALAESITTKYMQRESVSWLPPLIAAPVAVGIFVLLHSAELAAGFFGAVLLLALVGGFRWLASTTVGLSIRCPDEAAVGRVLDATATRAGLDVESVSWRYDIDPTTRDTMVERCIERANVRAACVAQGLGVEILGIHSYVEQHEIPQTAYSPPRAAVAMRAKGSFAAASALPAFGPLSSTERVGVTITVQYRVGGYCPPPKAKTAEP
jgi:hypothetical protein